MNLDNCKRESNSSFNPKTDQDLNITKVCIISDSFKKICMPRASNGSQRSKSPDKEKVRELSLIYRQSIGVFLRSHPFRVNFERKIIK